MSPYWRVDMTFRQHQLSNEIWGHFVPSFTSYFLNLQNFGVLTKCCVLIGKTRFNFNISLKSITAPLLSRKQQLVNVFKDTNSAERLGRTNWIFLKENIKILARIVLEKARKRDCVCVCEMADTMMCQLCLPSCINIGLWKSFF